jgi:sugar phosphate permease
MHGRIFGVATMSYGLGDVLARTLLGMVMMTVTPSTVTPASASHAWRCVFIISMIMAVLLSLPSLIWLENARTAPQKAINTQTTKNPSMRVRQIRFTLAKLFRKPKFWILIIMAPCLALIRETFISWTALYFTDALGMNPSDAAFMTLIFPLFGTVSTLLGGWAIDSMGPHKRGFVALVGCTGK